MAWKILREPNLQTKGNIGWCLAFAEDVYNTPHLYATATQAWAAVKCPHNDRNLPSVPVPVWYSYTEKGINFGHVAINVPGRGVLSSPYNKDNSQQWFKDIDECAKVLRCTYLGWSEDLATVKIISNEEDDISMSQADEIWKSLDNTNKSLDASNADKNRAWETINQINIKIDSINVLIGEMAKAQGIDKQHITEAFDAVTNANKRIDSLKIVAQ